MSDVLAQIEKEAEAAERRAVALWKIAEAARDLGDQGVTELRELFGSANGNRNGNGVAPVLPAVMREPVGDEAPRGREAVRLIVRDRPGVWTLAELIAEMKRRGWYASDKGVEAAAYRLCKLNNEGQKLGPGRYRFPDPQAKDEPSDAMPTMTAIDAVRQIVADRPGQWRLKALKREAKKRRYAVTPNGIEKAVRRLVQRGAAEPLGAGRYRFFEEVAR
jgi:hypothetical protein